MSRLSFSAITTYTTCGTKYKLRYKDGLRSRYFHAALAFGSAIDKSLNVLLTSKDIELAKTEFDKEWSFQWVNKQYVSLMKYPDLVYAESDFDKDLLKDDDYAKIEEAIRTTQLDYTLHGLELYQLILDEKKNSGWDNLRQDKKEFYNYLNWLSLKQKGYIMLESYNKKVMPDILEVLAVQKENYLKNSDGDEVVQYLDLIVKWKDGRNILFDNKTSAKEYDTDSASRSPQLISYYYGCKEEYNLNAVGFLVLRKGIHKNKEKVCSLCSYDGSGARHKTCSNTIDGKRCNGEWIEKINPECYIQVIINDIHPNAESIVLDTFNQANEGIKMEYFPKNLSACKQGPIVCEFYKKCWFQDDSELVDVSKKKDG